MHLKMSDSQSISIKDLRSNLAKVADAVSDGKTFEVFRRSKIAFRIIPAELEVDEGWETVIDFTEGGKREGDSIESVLKTLKKMNNGSN